MRTPWMLPLLAPILLALAACAVRSADAEPRTLRLLAYNIRHGQGLDGRVDLDRVAALIRAQDVDVVTLQEVDQGCGRTGGVDQAAELGRRCGMQHAFSAFMDYDGGRYGMAVLSRLPIDELRDLRLPDGDEPRTALAARVTLGGTPLWVTGIHLYRTEAERLAQAQALIDAFAACRDPVLLAGDFNSTPGSPVMRLLERHWTTVAKRGDPMTFPADGPEREIDFVLVRPAERFTVRRHVVVPEPLVSDHRPLRIDLQLAP